MLSDKEAIEAYVDAAAAVLDLPIAAEHRPGVLVNFGLLVAQASLVFDFPLDDRVDMAPVFQP